MTNELMMTYQLHRVWQDSVKTVGLWRSPKGYVLREEITCRDLASAKKTRFYRSITAALEEAMLDSRIALEWGYWSECTIYDPKEGSE